MLGFGILRFVERQLRKAPFLYNGIFRTRDYLREWKESHSFFSKNLAAIKQFNPDFIISHDVFPHKIVRQIQNSKSVLNFIDVVDLPDMSTRSGAYYRKLPEFYSRQIDQVHRDFIAKADLIFTTSAGHSDWLKTEMNLESHWLYNARSKDERKSGLATGVDLKAYFSLPPSSRLLVFHNQLSPSYGAERLIEALSRLPDHFHLVFAGPVSPAGYDVQLKQLTRQEGVEDRTHWYPAIWDSSILFALSSCDIGVIPLDPKILNITLGMPNRIFDLVEARIPIVTSKMKTAAAFIETHKLGLSSDIEPDKLAETIVKLDNHEINKEHLRTITDLVDLNWENEAGRMKSLIFEQLKTGEKKPHAIIIARKDASKNNRIKRQVASLINAGCSVALIDFANEKYRFAIIKKIDI